MNAVGLVCCFVMLGVASITAAPVGQQSSPFQRRGRRLEAKDDVKNYLRRFGHWRTRARNGSSETDDDMGNSLRGFQRFYKLNVTGKADNETLELMGTPRCGVPDNTSTISRRKRYSLPGDKWSQMALTYLFESYTSDLPISVSRSEIKRSFKDWSEVTPLSFTESNSSSATFQLLFARLEHGDGDPFDGWKGVLGHAFFPTDGRTHFDEDEQWTTDSQGTNLRQVATHEIGHALGLVHSRNKDAVMYPAYQYRNNFALHDDDIQQIQALYGKPKTETSSNAVRSTPSSTRTSTSTRTFTSTRTSTSTRTPTSTRTSASTTRRPSSTSTKRQGPRNTRKRHGVWFAA